MLVGLLRILMSYVSTAWNNPYHLESRSRQLLGFIVIRIIVTVTLSLTVVFDIYLNF